MKRKLPHICIVGPDGTGKSTQALMLIRALEEKGVKCRYVWLRFHHLVSLPLLAIARILGLSEMITLESGQKIGYHYFYRSKIFSVTYPILFFIDTLLFTIMKVYIPSWFSRRTIVYDRFIYDTIVDLLISTGRDKPDTGGIEKLFLALVPKYCKVVMLLAGENELRMRRDNILFDKTIGRRVQIYHEIAKSFNIPVIDATASIDEIHRALIQSIRSEWIDEIDRKQVYT